MSQTLKSLHCEAARIRGENQHTRVRQLGEGSEIAVRQVRQIAIDCDLWKHQALEAQAKLKSRGRAE